MKIARHIVKSVALLVSLGLCMVLLVSSQTGQWRSNKLNLIPRYVMETEVRGSTYHIHHGMWENRGYDHVSINHKKSKARQQFKQILRKRYPVQKL